MTEKAKRLTPTGETLRELFLKSGNLCAFPGCYKLMMNAEGGFIGQVCHIEAAEEEGERFNPSMTNEERRAASNLMLMCYEHHTVTNDVAKYPVDVLRQFKEDHEGRFSRPDRAMLEQLTDWTTLDEPTEVQSLKRMNAVLDWGVGEEQLRESAAELNAYVRALQPVPVEVRRFLGAVALRMSRVSNTRAVENGMHGTSILVSDLKGALRLSERSIVDRANELDAYRLGFMDEIETDLGARPAVRIHHLNSGWPLWLDIVQFCQKAPEPLTAFTDDLDFKRLD